MLGPAANIGTRLGLPIVILGVIFGGAGSLLAQIGIWVFSIAVLFQVVTLPVEFNASARAMSTIDGAFLLEEDERRGARKVLTAAALTYVAALLMSLAQLLRYVLIFAGRGGDRRR